MGAPLDAGLRKSAVAGEAVHDRPLWHPFVIENPQDVGVGVAVVDDERAIQLLREPDVIAERLLLRSPAIRSGPEVVESGLPHGPDVRVGSERGDLGEVLLVLATQTRSVVRVQGDGRNNGREFTCRLDGPSRRLRVSPDLDDAGDADCRRLRDGLGGLDPLTSPDAVIEVAVIVDDRQRQRLRRLRPRRLGGRGSDGAQPSAFCSMRGNRLGGLVMVVPTGS